MNSEWLNAFVIFAETPSLEVAAKKLGTTQPTLTRQLKALEENLGLALFSMQGRRKVLTQAGQELLSELKPRFQGLNEAIERVLKHRQDPSRIKIRLGARREILAMVGARISFQGHLAFEFLGHAGITQKLLDRELDAGITHELPDSLVIAASPLFRDEMKLCFPKSWRIADRPAVRILQDLCLERPFLAYDQELSTLKPLVKDATTVRIARTCPDWGILMSMIHEGFGWSIVPRAQLAFNPMKGVEVRDLPKDSRASQQFYLIYLKELARHDWFKQFQKSLSELSSR